ncbi:F-box protein [Zea mays]|uniref:F-box protein n=1 Tax=Zea mays TaxID=4577 RepID=A0A1D6H8A8_MAIZE|nr:F-box protein [Zea mays]
MVSLCLQAKRPRVGAAPRVVANQMGAFEVLPQELILSVLTALSSAADKPADLFNVMLVCQEFCRLVTNPQVIRAASAACVSVLPRRWCAAADRFLRCTGGWATRGSASPRTSGSWKPLPTTPSSMPTTAPMLLLCPLSTIIAPLTTTISVVLLLMLLLLSRHASTSRPASYSPALATTPLLSYVLS